jgi:uncharacterized LabA/DUF88 family protein
MIKKRAIERAAILVDWHNVLEMLAEPRTGIQIDNFIKKIMLKVQNRIAELLSSVDGITHFDCTMKVYHGWHSGRTPTEDRLQFDKVISAQKFRCDFGRTIGRIAFRPEINFGDQMDGDERYGTLFNTKRAQGQKMVDTSLACDGITMLVRGTADTVVIVSDDDDFIPAMIGAETLGHKVYLLRGNGRTLGDVCNVPPNDNIQFWK